MTQNICDLTGKVALITGGGSGIGKGIAQQFVALGAKVVITGRSKETLDEVAKELGQNCYAIVNDVTDKGKHAELLKTIEDTIGPLDILVNNAGKHGKKPALETTDQEFADIINVNLNSVFSLTREALKYMLPRQKGSVINITSMTALYGINYVVAYSSSKTALLGLTRTLTTEYAHEGIRFNCIAPGFIESKMFRNAMAKDPEREKRIMARTPAKRFGQPEDIATMAAFLASDSSTFITGTCIPVDGGNSIGF